MQICDHSFVVGADQFALTHGLRIARKVDFSKVPHLLIVAPSGSGKTYLLTYILAQLAKKPIRLLLADFKGVDFIEFEDCPNYYKHTAAADALKLTFDELQQRMANPKEVYQPLYFCVDEWAGFLSLYSKKEQEDFKQKMASILMLGRGVQVFVIMALQRADAAYITGRDNFGNCIGLGHLSKESVRMLFVDEAEQIQPKPRGKGYLRIDGKPMTEIVVPRIRNIVHSKSIIRQALQ
jgi:DNA segregation ATPase FtsK/SpoIIIE-like protein